MVDEILNEMPSQFRQGGEKFFSKASQMAG
jgi:hypothetical protein